MNAHVDLKIGALTEGFPTAGMLTFVWLCARVQVHVGDELIARLEDLAATWVRTRVFHGIFDRHARRVADIELDWL